ncbi:MAG: efflux RND transporter periplasmic adaptor subunit [Chitinophagaceae bacterium]
MRNNCIVNITVAGFLILVFISCNNKPGKNIHAEHNASGKELVIDSSLAILAKPVNAQVVSTLPAISPESGRRTFSTAVKGQITYDSRDQTSLSSRVSGRIERLYIKYNYQPVKQGQLIMEIYSPNLVAAQRELLFIAQTGNDDDMLSRSKQRLSLLGMQPAQISQVLKTGKALYRMPVYSTTSGYILEKQIAISAATQAAPASQASGGGMDNMGTGGATAGSQSNVTFPAPATPLLIREGQYVNAGQSLFTVYRSDKLVAEFALKPETAARIEKGQGLTFHTVMGGEKEYSGKIGLIQPVVRSGENFTLVRTYINYKDLLPGQLITANIPVGYKSGWWLPKKAVWQSGNTAFVFKKQDDVFVPVPVETGAEAEGMVMITTDIGNWKVAENAWYLIDSESFIKTTGQSK